MGEGIGSISLRFGCLKTSTDYADYTDFGLNARKPRESRSVVTEAPKRGPCQS